MNALCATGLTSIEAIVERPRFGLPKHSLRLELYQRGWFRSAEIHTVTKEEEWLLQCKGITMLGCYKSSKLKVSLQGLLATVCVSFASLLDSHLFLSVQIRSRQ